MTVQLMVGNNRTQIYGADNFLIHMISKELRYPSDIAIARESHVKLPDNTWDGWVRLLRVPKKQPPWFPSGLLDFVSEIIGKFGYSSVCNDYRVRPEGDVPDVSLDVPLRDYQEDAVNRGVVAGKGVFNLPPRAGKTRLMIELQRRLALRSIWIAPTDRIVRQTLRVINGFLGKNYAIHLVGTKNVEKAKKHRIVLSTAATAAMLDQDFYNTRESIVVDEWHHSASSSYHKIFNFCDHIYYRYGMTGTFFRSGLDAMAMHALLSNTIYSISSLELLQRGYLVPTHSVFLPVPCKRLVGIGSNTFQSGHGKYGIHEHFTRNFIVSTTATILHNTGRRVLILVGTKKQGYKVQEIIEGMIPSSHGRTQFKSVEFLSTDRDRNIQGKIIDSFLSGEEVKILIGTSLLGEGVDLPTADALVYARGEKAEVTLTQNMYRVGTAVDGKTHAIVVDFADRHHRKLLGHSLQRARVYHAEPTFTVQMLDNLDDFPKWLAQLVPNFEL